VAVWKKAVAEADRLSDELAQWLLRPDISMVQAL
jgi:hypothetical protein